MSEPTLGDVEQGNVPPVQQMNRKAINTLQDDVKDQFGRTYYGLPKGIRDSALKV